MLVPDLVDLRYVRDEAAGCVEVAGPQFVLLRVKVLFATLVRGDVLEQLEARVNPIARRQHRREDESDLERGRTSRLQKLVQDVGRVSEEIRTEVVGHLGRRELGEVFGELPLRVAPREVRVGLCKSDLRQVLHDLGTREGLGQEDEVRMLLLQRVEAPIPERERL